MWRLIFKGLSKTFLSICLSISQLTKFRQNQHTEMAEWRFFCWDIILQKSSKKLSANCWSWRIFLQHTEIFFWRSILHMLEYLVVTCLFIYFNFQICLCSISFNLAQHLMSKILTKIKILIMFWDNIMRNFWGRWRII